MDLSFRLYKHESGSLNRVNLSDQLLEKAFSQNNDTIWENVQSPKISAVNKLVPKHTILMCCAVLACRA